MTGPNEGTRPLHARRPLAWSCWFVIALACAACTTPPEQKVAPAEKPAVRKPAPVEKPVPPAAAPAPAPVPVAPAAPAKDAPPSRSVEELRRGVQRYDDGDYREAARHFQRALELGLAAPSDQANARKHLAFMHCVANRTVSCRQEFRKAFDADASFDLAPAEAGHPMWGPVFRSVKAEVAKKRKASAGASK